MIVVRGYRDGRRLVEDLGPAVAQVQGYGGETLGSNFVLTVVHQAQQRRIAIPRQPLAQARRRDLCPKTTRWGDPCARTAGHGPTCASREAMDRVNAGRRLTPE